MKKIILRSTVFSVFIGGMLLSGCKSSDTKAENEQENVQEEKENSENLDKELKDSISQFREEAERKIIAQEKSIAEFKARIAKEKKEKKENRAQYETKLAELEQRNTDIKKKLDDYKEKGKEAWETFKMEFSRDMDGIGEAFKNLTVKNVK